MSSSYVQLTAELLDLNVMQYHIFKRYIFEISTYSLAFVLEFLLPFYQYPSFFFLFLVPSPVTECPQAFNLVTFFLNFPICKKGAITVCTSYDFNRDLMHDYMKGLWKILYNCITLRFFFSTLYHMKSFLKTQMYIKDEEHRKCLLNINCISILLLKQKRYEKISLEATNIFHSQQKKEQNQSSYLKMMLQSVYSKLCQR